MFKYRYIYDADRNEKFYIEAARLANEEGPDPKPDGVDWYEVDLQGCDPETPRTINRIDLIVFKGVACDEIHITRSLDPDHRDFPSQIKGHREANTVIASLYDAETLVISNDF